MREGRGVRVEVGSEREVGEGGGPPPLVCCEREKERGERETVGETEC